MKVATGGNGGLHVKIQHGLEVHAGNVAKTETETNRSNSSF